MENPYAAPVTDVRQSGYDVAGTAPYTVAQMRSAFTRFAVVYWGYAALLIAMTIISLVMAREFAAAASAGNDPQTQEIQGWLMAIGFIGIAWFVVFVVMVIFACILLYRYWAVIADHGARTTPGKAVGFLFIPLFNLYWMFVAYHGLAKDIDSYLDKNRASQAPRPTTGFILVAMIIGLLTFVPVINNIAMLAFLVLMFITKLRLNNSIIGIIQDRARQQANAAPTK